MRIVLDTSVLIAALRSNRGASARLLSAVFEREVTLCMDYKLSCEYREVAMRPSHRASCALDDAELARFLFRLEQFAEPVEVYERIRPLSPDAADDMVLDVAIHGRVDALVTHNLRHFAQAGKRLNISVLTPPELLGLLLEDGSCRS